MPKLTIETEEQRMQADARIFELAGCVKDAIQEREMAELLLALDIWEANRRKGPDSFPTD